MCGAGAKRHYSRGLHHHFCYIYARHTNTLVTLQYICISAMWGCVDTAHVSVLDISFCFLSHTHTYVRVCCDRCNTQPKIVFKSDDDAKRMQFYQAQTLDGHMHLIEP